MIRVQYHRAPRRPVCAAMLRNYEHAAKSEAFEFWREARQIHDGLRIETVDFTAPGRRKKSVACVRLYQDRQ